MGAEVVRTPPQRRAQIGTANIADEQRIARENGVRLSRVLAQIKHQNRNRFDGVAGSLERLQAQSGELDGIAVLHGDESVFCFGAGTEMDGRAASGAQLQVPGDEVGVEVAEKYMADL